MNKPKVDVAFSHATIVTDRFKELPLLESRRGKIDSSASNADEHANKKNPTAPIPRISAVRCVVFTAIV